MKEIILFYLDDCPYCKKALKAIDDLKEKNPAYRDVKLHMVEETRDTPPAGKYDYYAVPSLFIGEEKQYECHLGASTEEIYANVQRTFEHALEG